MPSPTRTTPIAELVIENKPVPAPVLKAAIRRLTCKLELVPVLCGSAFKKRGVQPLVDAVVDYLPSPLDVPPAVGIVAGLGERHIEVPSDDNAQVLFAGLQALDRSLRRQARLLPRL